jgi:uncharacterized membrane protein YhaH (DUF805 family)
MNLGHLFTSFDGRIGRKAYWIGSLLLLLSAIVVLLVVATVGGPEALIAADGRSTGISTLITFLLLASSIPIVVKRLKDRNKSPYYAWLLYGPGFLSMIGDFTGITGTPDQPNTLGYGLGIVNLVIGLWFFIELGFFRGTIGHNQYGEDPVAPKHA